MTNPPTGLLAFFNVGTSEIVFIVVLLFLLFGAAKIPELMRSLGRAQGEFQKAKKEFEKEVKAQESKPTAASYGSPATPPATVADVDALRREAEQLGISTTGKDLETLRREVDEKKATMTTGTA